MIKTFIWIHFSVLKFHLTLFYDFHFSSKIFSRIFHFLEHIIIISLIPSCENITFPIDVLLLIFVSGGFRAYCFITLYDWLVLTEYQTLDMKNVEII